MKYIFTLLLSGISIQLLAQERPYYYQIPEPPVTYTATTAMARLVDGLGFRYYWATEGLTETDLQFRPSEEARSSYETLQHIYQLSEVLLNAVNQQPTLTPRPAPDFSFDVLREKTLTHIQEASMILKAPDASLEAFDMVFQGPDQRFEYPFWNLINGPVSDALWHVGQVVTFRRSSGNPFPSGVSVLRGRKR